jgi:hypothetical protein
MIYIHEQRLHCRKSIARQSAINSHYAPRANLNGVSRSEKTVHKASRQSDYHTTWPKSPSADGSIL